MNLLIGNPYKKKLNIKGMLVFFFLFPVRKFRWENKPINYFIIFVTGILKMIQKLKENINFSSTKIIRILRNIEKNSPNSF